MDEKEVEVVIPAEETDVEAPVETAVPGHASSADEAEVAKSDEDVMPAVEEGDDAAEVA
ncbi:hypothetical protein BH11PAT2_BH11PAT2_05980 [soil metagenome]